MIEQMIFIPGMSRSGTTWVSYWLAGHEKVALLDETYIMHRSFSLTDGRWTHKHVTDDHVRRFLTSVYEDASEGKPFIVDKSPASFMLDKRTPITIFIERVFPDAKTLIMFRDGKNFVYSVMNLPWRFGAIKTVEEAVDVWIRRAKCLLSRNRNFGPNTMITKYEDLISNPKDESKRIAEFVGLPDLPAIEPWKEPIKTKNTKYVKDRWKRFGEKDLTIMKQMNPYLRQFGYEPV